MSYKKTMVALSKQIDSLYELVKNDADGAVEFETQIANCYVRFQRLYRVLPTLTADKRNAEFNAKREAKIAARKQAALEIVNHG